MKPESGIIIVTGSKGRIGDALIRWLAGRSIGLNGNVHAVTSVAGRHPPEQKQQPVAKPSLPRWI